MKQFLNPDGKTYDGVRLMAAATGLSAAEIKWSFDRIKQLMHVEGKSKTEAVAILKTESAAKPWETMHG